MCCYGMCLSSRLPETHFYAVNVGCVGVLVSKQSISADSLFMMHRTICTAKTEKGKEIMEWMRAVASFNKHVQECCRKSETLLKMMRSWALWRTCFLHKCVSFFQNLTFYAGFRSVSVVFEMFYLSYIFC